MSIKMILTDLDGTLLRSDGSISERTKQILKSCQNRGIYVAIATARYWIGAERYIEEIRPDYEITTDGTLIHQQHKLRIKIIVVCKATGERIGMPFCR